LKISKVVFEEGEWDENYKAFYVPITPEISINELKPLFEESKKYRC